MKKFLIICFLISVNLLAQDAGKSPNVELPDFVITGNEEVQLPIAAKPRPDLVSPVSEEFFKPLFGAEDLQVKEFSDPLRKNAIFLDSIHYYKFVANGGVGSVSMPKFDIKANLPFTNTLINGGVEGAYNRAYTDYAGTFGYKGMLNFEHYFNREDGFLPGNIFSLNGKFSQLHYKYFGSTAPDTKSNLTLGDFKLGLKNLGAEVFSYSANVYSEYLNLSEQNISENNIKIKGFSSLSFSRADFRTIVTYSTQYLKNSALPELNTNYIDISGSMNIKFSKLFKIHIGMHYSKADTNSMFSPYGAIAVKIDKGFSLFVEYQPESEFITNKKLLEQNRYFDASNFRNFFFKKTGRLILALKYEYDKYYEIEAGFGYFSSAAYPYFSDIAKPGFFNVSSTDAKNVNGFVNLLFHPGPFGWLYGEFKVQSVIDSLDMQLPYYPMAEGFISYGNKLPFNITLESKLKFRSKMFADISNLVVIDPSINLSLKLYYPLFGNFYLALEADNLINQKSYSFINYLEPPINIIGGVNYNW